MIAGTFLISDSLILRIPAAIGVIVYAVVWFLYVHGPATWDRYRWIPNDGIWSAAPRVLCWLVGAAVIMIVMEWQNAI
jgi:hypothetical protein